jgi:hypothetical protein
VEAFDPQALSTFAQIGLGLAGFSGIGMLLTRSSARLSRFEAYRLGIMLGTTLGATFLAVLPLALDEFGWGVPATVRVCAALMAVYSFGFVAYFGRAIRYMLTVVPEIISWGAVVAVVAGHAGNVLLQAGNATGRLDSGIAIYSLGLLWLLLHGTYQFGRILFIRPRDEGAPAPVGTDEVTHV